MSDFLSRLTAADAPVAREVVIGEERGTVWFRRISAGEQQELLKGLKVSHSPGSAGTVEIDLAENERQRQLLVHFCACDASGKRLFPDLATVEKLPHHKLRILARHAEEVNRGEDDNLEAEPGKS